jgi:predicted enzyme related to lactoylglutathione lyase
MSRVVHFELPADDIERAAGFYTDVFGWKITRWDGPEDYYLISTGADAEPGINGGMSLRSPHNQAVVDTIDVANVDASLAKITKAGGTVTMPKVAIPGVGWLAYFRDTEGNTFGIMQGDPSAA